MPFNLPYAFGREFSVVHEIDIDLLAQGQLVADLQRLPTIGIVITGSGEIEALLSRDVFLDAALSGGADVAALIAIDRVLSASLGGSSSLAGELVGYNERLFDADVLGEGQIAAEFSRAIGLAATLEGSSSAEGSLASTRGLSAALDGAGEADADLHISHVQKMDADLVGEGSTVAALGFLRTLVFVATATGEITANLARVAPLSAELSGTGSIGATFFKEAPPIIVDPSAQEVQANMSANLREVTPSMPDPTSLLISVGGGAGAETRGLLDIRMDLPGTDADILDGRLVLHRSVDWPTGSFDIIVEPIDALWDPASVTWNTQPAVRAGEGMTFSVPNDEKDTPIVLDITSMIAAIVSNRLDWYGVRIRSTASTALPFHSAYGAPRFRPYLILHANLAPDAPYATVPAAGRVISKTQPELIGRFADPNGNDRIGGIRVMVDTTSDLSSATLTYDSGEVATDSPRFDLADPPTGAPAAPVLATETTYYWHMQVADNHGRYGPFSEIESFQVIPKGTVTLVNPAGGSVDSPTPTVSWTASDQAAYELEVEEKVEGIWLSHYLVARHPSTETSHTVPNAYRLAEGGTYRISVRVWDGHQREDMAGDRAFVEVQQEVSLTPVVV